MRSFTEEDKVLCDGNDKKKKKSCLINNHVSKIDLRKSVLDTFVMFNQLLTSFFLNMNLLIISKVLFV